MILLARAIACLIIFAAPFFLFVAMSKQQHSELAILVPLIGAIPAVIGALLLFAPVEYLLDVWQVPYLKNFVVPLVGGLLVLAFYAVMEPRMLLTMLTDLPATLIWMFLGAVWGGIWRLTDWLTQLAGFGTNGR